MQWFTLPATGAAALLVRFEFFSVISFVGLPKRDIMTVVASKVQEVGRARRALNVVASGASLVDLAVASPCLKLLRRRLIVVHRSPDQ